MIPVVSRTVSWSLRAASGRVELAAVGRGPRRRTRGVSGWPRRPRPKISADRLGVPGLDRGPRDGPQDVLHDVFDMLFGHRNHHVRHRTSPCHRGYRLDETARYGTPRRRPDRPRNRRFRGLSRPSHRRPARVRATFQPNARPRGRDLGQWRPCTPSRAVKIGALVTVQPSSSLGGHAPDVPAVGCRHRTSASRRRRRSESSRSARCAARRRV